MEKTHAYQKLLFLQGGGEMGVLTRAFPWETTSLGSPITWQQSLRSTLGILLHSAFPMFLFWGPEHLCFYNDAYRPSLGENGKHPAVGLPGMEVWPDIWGFIGPLIDQVKATGEAVWFEDQLLPIFRNGRMEDVYWTFSYSPAYGDSGEIAGVFVTCTETTEKVAAANKLRISERRFQNLVREASVGIVVLVGEEMRVEIVNDAYGSLINCSVEDLLGKDLFSVIPQAEDPFRSILDQVRTSGETLHLYDRPYTVTVNGVTKEGLLNVIYQPYREDGQITGVIALCQDITKQKKADSERQQLLSIIDASHEFIGMAAPDGRMQFINPAARKMLGWDDFEGKFIQDAIYPQDREHGLEVLPRVFYEGYFSEEIRFVNEKSGQPFWMQWSVFAIKDEHSGAITALATVSTDITARKATETSLRESERRFRDLVMQAPFGVAVYTGPELLAEMVNDKSLEMMGKQRRQMEGRPLFEALPQIRERMEPVIKKILVGGDTVYRNEVPTPVVKDGQDVLGYFNATWTPFRDGAGKVAGVMAVGYEVTEQVIARQKLEASEARFRTVFEQTPSAIGLLTGQDMVVEIANDTLLKFWGKGRTVVGLPLLEALPEIKDQVFMDILRGVYNNNKPFYADAIMARLERGGVMEDAYFDVAYTPSLDENGTPTGVIVLAIEVTMQVLARRKVEASEARFRALIEQAPAATFLLSGPNLLLEVVNESMIEMLGKGPDIIGRPYAEVMPELVPQGYIDQLVKVYQTGETFIAHAAPAEIICDEVAVLGYYDYTFKPMFGEDGTVASIICVAVDVSGQVRARASIEESEQQLRNVIESAPFPIGIYVGRELLIQFANQSVIEIFGKGPDVIGKRYRELLPELEGSGIIEQLEGVYDSGTPYHAKGQRVDLMVEGRMREHYFNYSFTPLYNAAGEVYAVMNTAAEVTDVVKSKIKIEEAEASLRGAIELAELGTWEIDMVARILDYDPRTRAWFGIGPGEIITPERAYQPVREADRPRIKAAIEHCITPGTDGIYDIEYTIDSADGLERILHAQGKAFYNEAGEVYKISGSAQDVTAIRKRQHELERQVQERTAELAAKAAELASANERLQRSNEELAQYAYVASHDLQEPLRKIRVFSGMMARQEGLSDATRALVGKVDAASERMSLLIKDLLEFSRLLNSESLVRPVDLKEVCLAVASDFELSMQEKGAVIHIGTLPRIQAIALQMNQLFYNLLSNALKFSKPGLPPRIGISSRPMLPQEVGRYISSPNPAWLYYDIIVKDNGIGFDIKYAEQIFEVFKRLHGRDIYPGSGIGLALCRRIALNAEGYLWAESSTGDGASFHIILPDRQG